MRELKFRCFDKRHKEMFYSDHERRLATFFDLFAGECCTEVIMQYIGLKDKNGKEIYEGDIIRETEYFNRNYEIRYISDECSFVGFKIKDRDCNVLGFPQLAECGEVIGNIYENPELLEV